MNEPTLAEQLTQKLLTVKPATGTAALNMIEESPFLAILFLSTSPGLVVAFEDYSLLLAVADDGVLSLTHASSRDNEVWKATISLLESIDPSTAAHMQSLFPSAGQTLH